MFCRYTEIFVSYTMGLSITSTTLDIIPLLRSEKGLDLLHSLDTLRGVSTARLNSALPVKVRRRPIWKPLSRGEPVMLMVGGGTAVSINHAHLYALVLQTYYIIQ